MLCKAIAVCAFAAASSPAVAQEITHYAGFSGTPGQHVQYQIKIEQSNKITGRMVVDHDEIDKGAKVTGEKIGPVCFLRSTTNYITVGICDDDGYVGEIIGQLSDGRHDHDTINARRWDIQRGIAQAFRFASTTTLDVNGCRSLVSTPQSANDLQPLRAAVTLYEKSASDRRSVLGLIARYVDAYRRTLPSVAELQQEQRDNMMQMRVLGNFRAMQDVAQVRQYHADQYKNAPGRVEAQQQISQIMREISNVSAIPALESISDDVVRHREAARQDLLARLGSTPASVEAVGQFQSLEHDLGYLRQCANTIAPAELNEQAALAAWVERAAPAVSGVIASLPDRPLREQKDVLNRLASSPSLVANQGLRGKIEGARTRVASVERQLALEEQRRADARAAADAKRRAASPEGQQQGIAMALATTLFETVPPILMPAQFGARVDITVLGLSSGTRQMVVRFPRDGGCVGKSSGIFACTYEWREESSISALGFNLPAPPEAWVRRSDIFAVNSSGRWNSKTAAVAIWDYAREKSARAQASGGNSGSSPMDQHRSKCQGMVGNYMGSGDINSAAAASLGCF